MADELRDLLLATQGALSLVRAEHGAARTVLVRLCAAASSLHEKIERICRQLEREFRGIKTYRSGEWPWDTARFSPTLIDTNPMELLHGFSVVCGPKGTLFDLGKDRLYYDLVQMPFDFDPATPVPQVPWTPRQLAARCTEIEEVSGLSISIYGESSPITLPCPCGAPVRNVVLPDTTPRLDRYPDDRLVRCGACGEVLVVFLEGLCYVR